MREKILLSLANLHARYPWRMFLLLIILSTTMFVFATRLQISMRTSDLLPEGDRRVVYFNRILEEFNTATNLVVVVQGEEKRIKQFADVLAPKILEITYNEDNGRLQEEIAELDAEIAGLTDGENDSEWQHLTEERDQRRHRIDLQLFQRIDYKAELDFLRDHMLMLIKAEDLENLKDMFMDPNLVGLIRNINNSMEKEYVGKEESISTREKEEGAVAFLDGIRSLTEKIGKTANGEIPDEQDLRTAVDKLLFGEPYMMSSDRRMLMMMAIPNFTLMDRDLIMISAKKVQKLVDEVLAGYPDVRAGLSGPIAREHDEMIYSEKSLSSSTFIALIVILVLLVVAFRMWVAPIFALLTLIIGVIWSMGVTQLTVGQLNMVTSMMAIVLFGLGIDFAIHIISGFSERRAAGDAIGEALGQTFLKNGKGVITGAMTTACAFLTLIISQARGMKEMGIVTGMGLLCIMLATFLFLPVLLVLRERWVDKRRSKKKKVFIRRDISMGILGRFAELLGRRWLVTITASAVVTLILVLLALQITFDSNYMNMEPKGLTSIALMDSVLEKYDLSMEYSLVIAESIEESDELAEKYRDLGTVALTDDISLYLPSDEEQQLRIPYINEIRQSVSSTPVRTGISDADLNMLTAEIDRLQMNVIEMQDMAFLGGQDKVDRKCRELVGDPENPNIPNRLAQLAALLGTKKPAIRTGLSAVQSEFTPIFRQSVIRMCNTDSITLADLPQVILDRYSNTDRTMFLVTIYPAGNIWQEDYLYRFVDDLERISEKVTGAAPLSIALLRIFGRDGRNAIILTLCIVFVLLWIDLRGIRYSLMSMVPLAVGFFWMLGLMHLGGMQLTMMSMIGLPMIVGIGIDDGVHIMHRWRHEGRGKLSTVFSSTGKAVMLTTLTTVFAFGSLVFSLFPAWAQFGSALAIGVAACFFTTIIILPGIIGFLERK